MKDGPDAVAEFDGLKLGDLRRAARAQMAVLAMQTDPAASFPQAMGSIAAREGFYRLVNNEAVDVQELIGPHAERSVERMRTRTERPIIAIDKTQFVFDGEDEREGLERLSPNTQGLTAFFALAVSPSRRTHGVVAMQPLDGKGRSSADEWSAFVDEAGHLSERAKLRPIYVMDQEAGAYALFCKLCEQQRDFVVRVSWDRVVKEFQGKLPEPFRDVASRAPIALTRDVQLSRRTSGGKSGKQRQRHPPRSTRKAELVVRACTITMPRPEMPSLARLVPELNLQLVHVSERRAPAGQPAVEWFLVTPLPIGNVDSVEAIVDAYRARWSIEEYFKALKTGCAYEQRQLESRHALLNALGLLIPLAWRLLELRTLAEDAPDTSAADVLEPDELHVLRTLSKDVKLGPTPSVSDVLLAVASVGGHIKQNGRPGWQVLYRGWRKLQTYVDGYRLAKSEM